MAMALRIVGSIARRVWQAKQPVSRELAREVFAAIGNESNEHD
jgi:hypothetical protein